MNERILDLASSRAFVSVSNGLLTLDVDGHEKFTVPPSEVAAVIAANYAVTLTREALATLAEAGAQVIVCDKRAMPVAMLLPLTGFHQPASRLRIQADAKRPVLKRLWRQIVRNKVRSQAAMLRSLGKDDSGFEELAKEVRSGDTTNIEAQAAKAYWSRLFGTDFRRNADAEDHNRLLNYGYALVRAMTCRAVCAAGLHPGLGVHHHHRANPFCLADDLMEPFRPVADGVVAAIVSAEGPDVFMTPDTKRRLLEIVQQRVSVGGERRLLFDAMTRSALSLAAVLEGRRKRLELPEWT
jgi:CRISPR-associated protein Cas1